MPSRSKTISARRSWLSCGGCFDRPVKVLGYNRQRIRGNWKLYAENTRDNYHASLLHEFLVTFGLDRSTQVGGVTMDAAPSAQHHLGGGRQRQRRIRASGLRRRRGAQRLPVAEGARTRRLPSRARRQAQHRDHLGLSRPRSLCRSATAWRSARSDRAASTRSRSSRRCFGYADDPPEMTLHRLRQAKPRRPGRSRLDGGRRGDRGSPIAPRSPIRTAPRSSNWAGGGVISDRDYRVTDVPLRGFWSYYAELLGDRARRVRSADDESITPPSTTSSPNTAP